MTLLKNLHINDLDKDLLPEPGEKRRFYVVEKSGRVCFKDLEHHEHHETGSRYGWTLWDMGEDEDDYELDTLWDEGQFSLSKLRLWLAASP